MIYCYQCYRRVGTQTIYDRWAMVLDYTTGEVQAIDCFNSTSDASGWPKPAWVIPNQSDLISLQPSEDGHSFLLATYTSAMAKWDRMK
jgi:hypothetical protein